MQTSYQTYMAPAFPGMIADSAIVQDIITCFSNGLAPFGTLAVLDQPDDIVKAPAASGDLSDPAVRGIVVATQEQVSAYPASNPALAPAYTAHQPLPIMRKGRIWVQVEDQVTVGTSVPHVRYAGSGVAGGFRATDDGTNSAPLPGAKFVTSTTGPNQLAILEIDL